MGFYRGINIVVFICLSEFSLAQQVKQMTIDDDVTKPGLTSAKWSNCAEEKSVVELVDFSLTPNPVILGKPIMVSARIKVSHDIGVEHVTGDMSIRIKIGDHYTDICNVLQWATCHTNDFCIWIERQAKRQRGCPQFLVDQGFNCTCPVKSGIYVIKDLLIPVSSFHLDIHGSFDVSLALVGNSSMLSCFEFLFCINKC